MTPKATDVTLPVGQYEEVKNVIEKQRNTEYNKLLQEGKIGKVLKFQWRQGCLNYKNDSKH